VAVLGDHRRRHAGEVGAVAWSSDGRWIASAGKDGITLLDAKTLRERPLPLEVPRVNEGGLAFSRDGTLLAPPSARGVVLGDVSRGEPREHRVLPAYGLRQLAWAPDGKTLAGTDSLTIVLWDLDRPWPVRKVQLKDVAAVVSPLTYAPDGKSLAF